MNNPIDYNTFDVAFPSVDDVTPVPAEINTVQETAHTATTAHMLVLRAYATAMAVKQLHWVVTGNDFGDVHEFLDECYGLLLGDADYWGEFSIESEGSTPELIQGMQEAYGAEVYMTIPSTGSMDVLTAASNVMSGYLDLLKQARTEYDNTGDIHGIVSVLDELIRRWSKQINYFLASRM